MGGFVMIYLPFANDMRKIPYDKEAPKADKEQVEFVEPMVDALTSSKFSSTRIRNPGLALHYRTIEAIAFNREGIDEVIDETDISEETITKDAGPQIQNV